MKFLALIITFCMFTNLKGQNTPCVDSIFSDNQLDILTEKWIGKGTVASDPVVYQVTGKWILNHQFFQLSLRDTAKIPAYEAEVFIGFDCSKKQYIAHWIDQFGGPFSKTLGLGLKTNFGIDFHFDYPNGLMITHFIIKDKSTWEMKSEMKNKDGNWDVFGDIMIKRN